MPVPPLSITDFMTDGSLVRLCEVTSRLIERPVELHDADGRVVTLGDDGAWRSVEPAPALAHAGCPDGPSRTGSPLRPSAPPGDSFSSPIVVGSRIIGRISSPQADDAGAFNPERRRVTERFLGLLASTVSEVCQRELEQRERAEELNALYRVSSLLVGAHSVGSILAAGLRSAVEALDADAGVVRMHDEATGELRVRARWQTDVSATPLEEFFDAARDSAALAGEVVSVEDLLAGPARADGGLPAGVSPRGLLAAGLRFQDEPLGVLCLHTRAPRVWTESERVLARSIAQLLAAAAANARLAQAEADGRRVSDQIRLGADVQRRMMPRSAPQVGPLDMDALYEPCFELGGDFYDLFELGGHVGLIVGDVVGKGVAAALLMSAVRATLRAHARDVYDVDEIIARTNQALCRDTMSNEFATVFYGVIDPRTLRMTYCNAGHDAPLVVHRRRDGSAPTMAHMSELSSGGMVLGVDPDQRYHRGIFDLAPGDVLLASTDGLADSMNFEGRKFGAKRVREALLDVLRLDPDASAKRVAQHVHWERRRFTGVQQPTDDTTIVVVRVRDKA